MALISRMPSSSGGGEGRREGLPHPQPIADFLGDLFE